MLLVRCRAGDSNLGTGLQTPRVLPLHLPEKDTTHQLKEQREQSSSTLEVSEEYLERRIREKPRFLLLKQM